MIKNVSFGNSILIPNKTSLNAIEFNNNVAEVAKQTGINCATNRVAGTTDKDKYKEFNQLITSNDLDEYRMLVELGKKYPELDPTMNYEELYANNTRILDVNI